MFSVNAYLFVAVVGDENGILASDGFKELEHHFLLAWPGVDEKDVYFV